MKGKDIMSNIKEKKEFNLLGVIAIIIVITLIIVLIINTIKKDKKKDEQQGNEGYVATLDDDTKINISPKVNETKILNELELTDIKLTYKDGVTNLLATVKNTKNKKIEMMNVEIQLMNENGEIIYSWPGIIEDVEAGETVQLNSSITAEFVDVYDVKIVEK